MKVNLNWLADLVDLPTNHNQLIEIINRQLGEVETVEDLSAKYKDVLVVKIVEIKDHPQADNLKVCLIDDKGMRAGLDRSRQGYLELVCGAPNLRVGMLACWLPPNSRLPADFNKESAQLLEVKTIRGVASQGMLASALELDLASSHQTILELKSDKQTDLDYKAVTLDEQKIGQSLTKVFALDTLVLDIDNKMFTHRPDCFGLIGIAREVAAICRTNFKSPTWYHLSDQQPTIQANQRLSLDIQTPDLSARLQALIIDDLKPTVSDLSLQFRLASIGIKPVNNIVDWTNYMMYLSGQPSHAFDYDKLVKASHAQQPFALVVRQSRVDESLKLINGKTLKFEKPALVIATNKQPVALAGIMGGAATEVDAQTKTVLLECANFNMYDLYRTSMHYGVFSEAATRFTKGQSLTQIPPVALMTANLIAKTAQGQLQANIYECQPKDLPTVKTIKVSVDFINQRLGSDLSFQEMVNLLEDVEFKVVLKESQVLEVKPPFWRTDIVIKEDLVEEIGRLNDYHRLSPQLPQRLMQTVATNQLLDLKTKIRNCLAARGANEVLNYSFVGKDWLKANQQDPKNSFELLNPLNPKLEVYRQSLTPSLLLVALNNRRNGYKDLALFEVGCTHHRQTALDDQGLPLDLERTALIILSQSQQPFYLARRYLDLIGQNFKLVFDYQPLSENQPLAESLVAPYQLQQSALIKVNQINLGIIGLLKSDSKVAAWEIETDSLLKATRRNNSNFAYQAISRYPQSLQDLTLRVPLDLNYSFLKQIFDKVVLEYQKKSWQISWRLTSIYQPRNNLAVKHITTRWDLAHYQKTLEKQEVVAIINQIVQICQKARADIEKV